MLLKAARATRGVGINAQYAQRLAIGAAHGLQLLVQRLFQLLGSLAHGAHVLIPTIRACARNPHGIPAMVTAQSAVNLVEHPVGAAMRTLAFPATARAVQDRRIPAAIEQKQALLATQCALLHRLEQRLAAHGAARLLRHVDHTHRGQSCRADALGHAQPQVTAARIVLRCRRRRDGVRLVFELGQWFVLVGQVAPQGLCDLGVFILQRGQVFFRQPFALRQFFDAALQ